MDHSKIKILDLEISREDVHADTKSRLLAVLRPDWPQKDITYSENDLSGGFLNIMTCYHLVSDPSKEDAVVVRVYGGKADEKTFLHDQEILTMQVAHAAGVFPGVWAFFQNGVVYQYAVGKTLQAPDLHQPHIYQSIARSLADLHMADLRGPLMDRCGKEARFPREFVMIPRMYNFLTELDSTLPDSKLSKQDAVSAIPLAELRQELDYVVSMIKPLDLYVGLTHGDVTHYNLVYNNQTDKIYVLDYEFSSYDYVAFDFVYLLRGHIYRNCYDHFTPKETASSKDEIRDWIRHYLLQRLLLDGRDSDTVSEEHIQLVEIEMDIMEVLMHLFWHTVKRHTLTTNIPLPLALFEVSRNGYYSLKPALPRLCEQHQQLKKKLESR